MIDVLVAVAKEIGSRPARVALAWLQAQPGVTSIIIGARSVAQLDENLAAVDVALTADQLARLDEVSRPTLDFPAGFLRMAGMFSLGGATVNGESAPLAPNAPRSDSERW